MVLQEGWKIIDIQVLYHRLHDALEIENFLPLIGYAKYMATDSCLESATQVISTDGNKGKPSPLRER